MSDKNHVCGNCRFFRQGNAGPGRGECHISPIQTVLLMMQESNPLDPSQIVNRPMPMSYFPKTGTSEWCGKWEEAEEIAVAPPASEPLITGAKN